MVIYSRVRMCVAKTTNSIEVKDSLMKSLGKCSFQKFILIFLFENKILIAFRDPLYKTMKKRLRYILAKFKKKMGCYR